MLRGSVTCVAAALAVDHRPGRRQAKCTITAPATLKAFGCQASSLSSWPEAFHVKRDDLIASKFHQDILSDYDIKRKLGEGAYGQVLLATQRRTGIDRAVKQINKSSTQRHEFEEEVNALMALDHPHIVKIIEYYEDKTDYCMVEELCNGPTVSQFIKNQLRRPGNHGVIPEEMASVILRQCLKAVAGCHAMRFIHRDLKPENFVFTDNQVSTVKLIDFGLATRFLLAGEKQAFAGTPTYMAPEMVLERPYTSAVDVWSLGALFYLLLTGEPLLPKFMPIDEKMRLISDPTYVPRLLDESATLKSRGLSLDARDLLIKMLAFDPAKRIDTTEALSHPFILKHDCDLIDLRTSKTFRRNCFDDLVFDPELINRMRCFAAAPQLQKIAMLAMTHLASINGQSMRSLAEQASSRMNPSGDGSMSLNQLKQALASQGFDVQAISLLSAQATFRIMDINGDAEISLNEFKQVLVTRGFVVPGDIDAIFAACDANGNGKLNFSEFVASSLSGDNEFLSETLCRETFNLLDKNHDGRIGPVDLELLCKSLKYDLTDFEAIIREAGGGEKGYLDFETFYSLLRSGTLIDHA